MKTLKIYNIIATVIILLLVIWINTLQNDLIETEEIMQQCTERYYQKIGK
ncbi:hypothetical protein IV494_08570 [Kaistella sp. G5-32]|uniref:Uncharacterized protein n=1 Tax=Kaistella gelatinilytica TaxID=2787636 RepID=A0ABS0FC05_9FLAO|nr:hypothetical protein [Kaistella gelatinilytica]MBF8457235.1 hypothetical protein [Kaistella gelatinilytica]